MTAAWLHEEPSMAAFSRCGARLEKCRDDSGQDETRQHETTEDRTSKGQANTMARRDDKRQDKTRPFRDVTHRDM